MCGRSDVALIIALPLCVILVCVGVWLVCNRHKRPTTQAEDMPPLHDRDRLDCQSPLPAGLADRRNGRREALEGKVYYGPAVLRVGTLGSSSDSSSTD